MACQSSEVEDFYKELDDFHIKIPGGGTKTVTFADNEVLLKLVCKMYPNWKEDGKVTSIPIARIPKLFLHNMQMCKKLQKSFKLTQTGDWAEKVLYSLFLEGSFPGQPGIMVFPNVNGNELFQTKVAKVEIDMIVVHQTKGVFIFNVKNVRGKGLSSEKIEKDIEKHKRFVRLLLDYRNTNDEVPIHSIICCFDQGTSSDAFKHLKQKTENSHDKIIVLLKNDLKKNNFSDIWNGMINGDTQHKSETVEWSSTLDLLVARLITLNSAESSAALIHEQMRSGFLQSVTKRKHLETQVKSFESDQSIGDVVVKMSETENRKGKKKYILWTNEQMKIIAKVYGHLVNPKNEGLRLVVEGCKGSGKTMLLVFIAKLSQFLLQQRQEYSDGSVMIYDSSWTARVLMSTLEQELESTGIALLSNPGYLIFLKSCFYDLTAYILSVGS